MTFGERFAARAAKANSLLCVGLDIEPARLPAPLHGQSNAMLTFAEAIIESTADIACAYKPNLAFYLAQGVGGMVALGRILAHIRERVPDAIVILDAKFGDIGNTAASYARYAYDVLGADAVTVNPYLGEDALLPFLGRGDRVPFILCKTSNPGSGDLQDLPTGDEDVPLYEVVAHRIASWGARHGSCGVVVGATYTEQVALVRSILPAAPLLIPGVGAQGGELEATVRAGVDRAGGGILINASRSILYASSGSDFQARARAAALELRDAINLARAGA